MGGYDVTSCLWSHVFSGGSLPGPMFLRGGGLCLAPFSFGRGRGCWGGGGLSQEGGLCQERHPLRTVDDRAVRVLFECLLVSLLSSTNIMFYDGLVFSGRSKILQKSTPQDLSVAFLEHILRPKYQATHSIALL